MLCNSIRPVIAGNWKMHKGPDAAAAFVQQFAQAFGPRDDRTIVLFPPAISLTAAKLARGDRQDLHLGVQNIHWEKEGAFTGELSAAQAREAGAGWALIGHSERRHLFGETDQEVALKVKAATGNALVPMICVGETLDQRRAGQVDEVILRQLGAALEGVANDYSGAVLIAYEPVWAIGTGVTATPADASEAHRILRAALDQHFGNDSIAVPILYGGSVKPDNAGALLAADGVDGLLVGGASLDVAGFARIAAAG